MKFRSRRIHNFVLANLLIFGTTLAPVAIAQTVYISDELTVPLRSGPSTQHRILHAGLPTGMALEVVSVDEQAGYTQIVTQRGTEGWIRSQYLVTQPIAKIRLQQAQRQLAKAQDDLRKLQEERQALRSTNQSQANENQQREGRIQALESELEEIKRVSADAIETHNENQRLNQTNVRLQDELDDLSEAYTRLEDNAQNEAILIGAGLILLGLLAGVIIKARPQRSAWS